MSDSYSQFGEDKIIFNYFNKTNGYFLEIGANDPIQLSQTYLLEKKGWKGVLIEPLPHLVDKLRAVRKNSQIFQCGVSSADRIGEAYIITPKSTAESEIVFEKPDHCEFQPTRIRTLNDILAEANCGEIDFMSVDVEGMEIASLSAFDFGKYKPKLILMEDHCDNYIKHNFLKEKGYKWVNRMGCNNWYVPNGIDFKCENQTSKFEFIRKFYLSMPFRKLRVFLKGL